MKRSFFLLEALVIFVIVLAVLFPLTRQTQNNVLKQIASLEKIECERLANEAFSSIKASVYRLEIPFKEFPDLKAKSKVYSLSSSELILPGFLPRTVERRYEFFTKKKKVSDGKELLYLDVEITLFSSQFCSEQKTYHYQYPLIVRKKKM